MLQAACHLWRSTWESWLQLAVRWVPHPHPFLLFPQELLFLTRIHEERTMCNSLLVEAGLAKVGWILYSAGLDCCGGFCLASPS